MSLGPAQGRGGSGNARELLARSKMKKASQRSVVEEMASVDGSAAQAPVLPPAGASPVESAAGVSVVPQEVLPPAAAPVQIQAPAPETVVPPVQAPVPHAAPADTAPAEEPGVAEANTAKATKKSGFWQTTEQWERTRSTYEATRRFADHKSLSEYVAIAVENYNRLNEEMYNNGEPFDADPFNIPKGRPLR